MCNIFDNHKCLSERGGDFLSVDKFHFTWEISGDCCSM